MSDLVFVDTETLGIESNSPVWEFAAIRRSYHGKGFSEKKYHCFIEHRPWPHLKWLPDEFKVDYLKRYRHAAPGDIVSKKQAADIIDEATQGAHVVGAVPNFDTERLARLLYRNGIKPPAWHYHLVDVENLIVGYLAAKGELMQPPWKSDDLSRAIGVEPKNFERHTAMGDVKWIRAQYDAIMETS
jgi:hypothetical protein